jgi:hypothetical protein
LFLRRGLNKKKVISWLRHEKIKTNNMKKIFPLAVLTLGIFALGATYPSASGSNGAESDLKQCGVSNGQIVEYLQSHGHTVVWGPVDIPGTCNSRAGIENCSTATVYVENRAIIGFSTSAGYCTE